MSSREKLPVRKVEPPDDSVDEAGLGEVSVTTIRSVLVYLRSVLTVVNLQTMSVRRQNIKHTCHDLLYNKIQCREPMYDTGQNVTSLVLLAKKLKHLEI